MKTWLILFLCVTVLGGYLSGCRIVHQGDSKVIIKDLEKLAVPAGAAVTINVEVATRADGASSIQTKEVPFDVFRGTTAAVMPGARASGGIGATGSPNQSGDISTTTTTTTTPAGKPAVITPASTTTDATDYNCPACGTLVCPSCGDTKCPKCGAPPPK